MEILANPHEGITDKEIAEAEALLEKLIEMNKNPRLSSDRLAVLIQEAYWFLQECKQNKKAIRHSFPFDV